MQACRSRRAQCRTSRGKHTCEIASSRSSHLTHQHLRQAKDTTTGGGVKSTPGGSHSKCAVNAPVVSARESTILAHKSAQLLALRVILIVFGHLNPRSLLEVPVARIDTLLDDVSIVCNTRAHGPQACPPAVTRVLGTRDK
jgi:hypothetical protein